MTRFPDVVEVEGAGRYRWVDAPRYGRQDLGYSPGGALDRLSHRSGNILLDNGEYDPALEITVPPDAVRFGTAVCIVLTGGGLEAEIVGPAGAPAVHAVVYCAPAGSELRFGRRRYGFRTYLCGRPVAAEPGGARLHEVERLAGRKRGEFGSAFRWPDPQGSIRVVPGPEHRLLPDPTAFFSVTWRVTNDVSGMGIRLAVDDADPAGPERPLDLGITDTAMISSAVCDGAVQMTPSGPIVLLRGRQTVGGYPRVFVVVNADVDLLAQYAPGRPIRFTPVDLEEAWRIDREQEGDLERLRARTSGS